MAGSRTHFIRLGGCDYRCSWCDTPYAVLPEHRRSWSHQSLDDIVAGVEALGTAQHVPWVTISGGNPALFKRTGQLVNYLQVRGYLVAVETQGSIVQDWLAYTDHTCLSPKPPSSGMTVDREVLLQCYQLAQMAQTHAVKIVVFDDDDLTWALQTIDFLTMYRRSDRVPFYLSAGTPQGQSDEETKAAIIDRTNWLHIQLRHHSLLPDVRVLPQLHVLLWGTARGK